MSDPKLNIRERPAGGQSMPVGNERKADVAAAQGTRSVVGETSLKGGVKALMGDHSGGVPHMPLHGMRPCK